ncbi:beta-N-acetylhexosaminidase [Schnuerera ultunensis]|uniref:beta-N-acetylhexosaminidase n=1 Tax=[Clostridium] ultunense Esp TaxID=1288971 RepID=A0A1M4PQ99_9FIRM|nr:beta-N-acetylhexosaminidase [Schnuerera ultunensis]SHD77665.1 Anhydromuramoyl-peptideexo-beta-N-acetylglucosaminidase [[Clostridium] ultunense Esp]
MNRKILIIILIGLILIIPGCRNAREENKYNYQHKDNAMKKERKIEPTEKLETKNNIQEKIDSMTLDEKIGQLMIVGINGYTIDDHTKEIIEKFHIGGFTLFKYNISEENQTLELLNSLKKANSTNPIPLFLSVDEEGGRVSRLPNSFLKLPAARKIGEINDRDISFEYGKIIGKRLKSLGFNMNFGPVLDINSNPKNPVIGDRAFGSTIETVIENGIQVMKGTRSENIIPVTKHFPGHGDTDMDSHIDLPVINKDIKELEELELAPFIEGIRQGVDGIMVGHILFPELDNKYPATLSKEILTKLLREKLSYKGVIISDDMTMGTIIKNYNIEEAAVKFLKAGGDLLLICHGYENQIKIINRIKEEVNNGTISEEELDEKIYRILQLKEKYKIEDNIIDKIEMNLLNSKTKELLNKISR